ncbi:MAG TPA: ATP phosphoribosyltransferase regulatory subunit [Thermoanaerobaculia bacterium]|nr:ATP phosphoribosyltransferase regulatory subunit [Thermoanaerobaculia bacterium]
MGTSQFRYPTGARPLLIEETARRRRIESRFVGMLEGAGFAEVVLPIIDFSEPYTAVTDRGAARHSYRFVDRDGELVTLRSDFTPMVARALAPAITASDLPLRVFYRGDVVRCESTRLGANRELFQIGAELIGDGSLDADREVLRLVAAIAAEFIDAPVIVHTSKELADEFTYHEDAEESAGYYTGLRFWVYGANGRTQLAQGGRYDSLYGRFGTGAPAIGFTFTLDELED